jgi:hypothetical protein
MLGRERLLIIAAFALIWCKLLFGPEDINHDVAWFYYVANGVMHGGTLYRDYIEPNAPLASLSLVPAVLLTRLLEVSADLGVEIYVLLVASLVLLLDVILLKRLRFERTQMAWALGAMVVAFVVLPKSAFEQREHLLFMLLTPYILACVAACEGVQTGPFIASMAGLAGMLAVGLKPPFLLVPALAECVVLYRAGLSCLWRAQTISFTAGLCGLTAITVTFFPLYTQSVVPWAVALYSAYGEPGGVLADAKILVPAAIVLCLLWRLPAGRPCRALRALLMASFAGSFGAFAVQEKGWFYHVFPAGGFLFFILVAVLANLQFGVGKSRIEQIRFVIAQPFALVCVCFIAFAPARAYNLAAVSGVAAEISSTPGPFVILSTSVFPGFPLALKLNRIWASRYSCMIMLPGLISDKYVTRVANWESSYRATIVSDMNRYKPTLVMIPADGDQALPAHFDILNWLLRDPAFAKEWQNYAAAGERDGLRIFRR